MAVHGSELDGVAGVAQLDEGDAFDDAAVVDVEARDNALRQHYATTSSASRRSMSPV
jgi:hypothetical protein